MLSGERAKKWSIHSPVQNAIRTNQNIFTSPTPAHYVRINYSVDYCTQFICSAAFRAQNWAQFSTVLILSSHLRNNFIHLVCRLVVFFDVVWAEMWPVKNIKAWSRRIKNRSHVFFRTSLQWWGGGGARLTDCMAMQEQQYFDSGWRYAAMYC